jgi:hypothetical protein
MIQRRPVPAILKKFPVEIPRGRVNKYEAYTQCKRQFQKQYGWIDPDEYTQWIHALAEELGV